MARPVLVITGAAGNLGSRLRRHLEERGDFELRLLDIAPGSDSAIHHADLSRLDAQWMGLLQDADTVVHLAATSRSDAGWDRLTGPNVDGVLNLYHAASQAGVKRVVLASSVWAMAARRQDSLPIGTTAPDPGGHPYGSSKLFAERVAAFHHATSGLSTTILRIGGCPPGDNRPWRHPDPWENDCWLSTADFCRGMDRVLDTPLAGCHIVNLTSANPAQRWSLAEAESLLGFIPRDSYDPPARRRPPFFLKRWIKKLISILIK